MQFDPDNKVVKLCTEGMSLEGEGKPHEAADLFNKAWNVATTDFEKFTAAHYVARHQDSVAEKLRWDKIALQHALQITDNKAQGALPSLYLNIAKGYEDLNNFEEAQTNYESGLFCMDALREDGYRQMIKSGLMAGLKRLGGYINVKSKFTKQRTPSS